MAAAALFFEKKVSSLAIPSRTYYSCASDRFSENLAEMKNDELFAVEESLEDGTAQLCYEENDGQLFDFYRGPDVLDQLCISKINQQKWLDLAVQAVYDAAGCSSHVKAQEYLEDVPVQDGMPTRVKKAFVFVFESGASFGGAKKGKRSPIHLTLQRHLIKKVIVYSDNSCGLWAISSLVLALTGHPRGVLFVLDILNCSLVGTSECKIAEIAKDCFIVTPALVY